MLNAEVFARNPLNFEIPNSGVTVLNTPSAEGEWAVLRWELESFVCEGQYAEGLRRLLSTYLKRVDDASQPAWWVSGFYGSGKSHFVRVLEHLWADTTFPDGSSARSLVRVPPEVSDLLRELSIIGRREGGVWSASGTLGSGAAGAVRLAFVTVLFRAAGLPASFHQARLTMWLREKGILEAVQAHVTANGESWRFALDNMYMSLPLSQAIRAQVPGYDSDAEVRSLLREQFPHKEDLSDEEMLRVTEDVLALITRRTGRLPCVLVVLDELQQFIGDSLQRVDEVARLVESVSGRFGGKLLLVATGQSAMGATPQLQKIKDRFPMPIELSSADVEQVVRNVILRKNPQRLPDIQQALEAASGEIARHLSGSKLAPREEDRAGLVADYPVLPTRRRLWDDFLRAIDRAGSSGQLRSQLRITHEANQSVANAPLGHVVGADFVYPVLAPSMLSAGTLLGETHTLIQKMNDGSESGKLRQRLAQLMFILSRLDARQGVLPTEATLADLLVEDLAAGSADLRQKLPGLLKDLVEGGQVMRSGDEYRLQTREGAEWEGSFRSAYNRLRNDDVRQVQEREALLKKAVDNALKGQLSVNQGSSKTARKAELFYSAPPAGSSGLPVWIRDGWSESASDVQQGALAAGDDSPTVFVYLSEPNRTALKEALATWLAAREVLSARPHPNTQEAREASSAMQTRMRIAADDADRLISQSLEGARVFQGGGQELEGGLRNGVQVALQASVKRLYPQFSAGDHARWDTALKQAKQGNHSALESVDFSAEPATHPVLRSVLTEVGAGKKGKQLRDAFMAAPYGWPQDAVDTALVLLTLTNHLKANFNGSPLEAKQLDAAKLTQSDFRLENVTLNKVQLIGVRGVYQDAGISAQAGQEAAQAETYLSRLSEKVAVSGGEAPAPERLSSALLGSMQGVTGNELLLKLYEARDELKALRAEADARAALIGKRRDHWEKLQRLLNHSPNADLQAQADAIHAQRLLLAEPDPVGPLATEVMNGLRSHLADAVAAYTAAYQVGLSELSGVPGWTTLPEEERQVLLSKMDLTAPAPLKLSTITEVVNALDQRRLSEWRSTTEALPSRFEKVRAELLKKFEPKARSIKPPHATLKSELDIDAYLQALRSDLLKVVESGDVVVIL